MAPDPRHQTPETHFCQPRTESPSSQGEESGRQSENESEDSELLDPSQLDLASEALESGTCYPGNPATCIHPKLQAVKIADPNKIAYYKCLWCGDNFKVSVSPHEIKVKPPVDPDKILPGFRYAHLSDIASAMRALGCRPEHVEIGIRSVNQEYCYPPLDEQDILRILSVPC